eukprot:9995666-Ditylum_brightwellii.AAC.1
MLWNIQQSACNCVNDLATDEMEVDEFEEDELGNISMDVLILIVQATYGSNLLRYTESNTQVPSRFIICKKDMNSIASLLFMVCLVINGC